MVTVKTEIKENWKYYHKRNEPSIVKNNSGYINLRSCRDIEIISQLEAILRGHSEEAVIIPWLSQPFGTIEGYGLYSKKEASDIVKLAKKEGWVHPNIGHIYDLIWFKNRISEITKDNYASASK